jgi:hypothetical protein
VTLDGEAMNLDHAARLLGRAEPGGARVGTISTPAGRVLPALFSGSFDALTEHSEVHEEARRLLDMINGLLVLTDQSREPLRLGTIHPRDGDGWGTGYLMMAGRVRIRSWAGGNLDGAGMPGPLPPEVRWIALAQVEPVVGDVLRFLKAPEPDWLDLYMASELLESGAGQAWWPKARFGAFTASSQVGRHARGPHENLPPERLMSLGQARGFIADLVRLWLDWWIADEAGARAASRENERRKRKEGRGKEG